MKLDRWSGAGRFVLTGIMIFLAVPFAPSVEICAAQGLKAEFANPPAASRMASYGWIFGPAWTKTEIKRELTVFRKAGIGRILIYPLYPYSVNNPPKGIYNQKYLSPKFLATLRYAADTAREMSIRCDLVMGSGWPYGGHQIPESLSPERIFAKISDVSATPGREATIGLPKLQQFEKIIPVQLVPKPGEALEHSQIDLTGNVNSSGKVTLRVPPGKWQLMTVIEGPTTGRHKVIFAAAGGGGNVIDHLNPNAVNLYLHSVCDKLAQAVHGRI